MERNVSLDILKLLMAFMVVGLHADFLDEFSALGSYLFVNGLFRTAVPVFLIINGFYFFSVLAKNTQSSWLKRVSTLYIIWMLFYAPFWLSIPDLSLFGIAKLVKDIVIGYYHLWYISGMLGAAILMSLLNRFSSLFLIGTILASSLTGIIIQYLGNYHFFGDSALDKLFNTHWLHRNALLFSYPFFCIGYLIRKHRYHEKITLKSSVTMSSLGIILLLVESHFNYYQAGREGGFDNYFSLLIACPFIFIIFSKMEVHGNSKNIALYSSAIYFIHLLFLNLLKNHSNLEPTALTFSCIAASAATSYFIIKINKKIRYIL